MAESKRKAGEDFFQGAAAATSSIQMFYVSSKDIQGNKPYLENRWEHVKSIPGLQGRHFFATSDECHLKTAALIVQSVKEKYQVFQPKQMEERVKFSNWMKKMFLIFILVRY